MWVIKEMKAALFTLDGEKVIVRSSSGNVVISGFIKCVVFAILQFDVCRSELFPVFREGIGLCTGGEYIGLHKRIKGIFWQCCRFMRAPRQ